VRLGQFGNRIPSPSHDATVMKLDDGVRPLAESRRHHHAAAPESESAATDARVRLNGEFAARRWRTEARRWQARNSIRIAIQ
jgi:hypothetical protein